MQRRVKVIAYRLVHPVRSVIALYWLSRQCLQLIADFLFNPSRSAIFLYRLSHRCEVKHWHKLALFIQRVNITLHNVDIAPAAKLGDGFDILHSIGVVIGGCTAGKNLKVFQNVTIGSKHMWEHGTIYHAPIIGDNVHIFAGAVVLGNINIGNNAIIGANSVVLADVPDNCTVVGAPARIVKRGG